MPDINLKRWKIVDVEFPYKKGDVVQSELFAKMYYTIVDCDGRTSFKPRYGGVKRIISEPYMDKGCLVFNKNNLGKYEELIIFENPTEIDFYHHERDEYPHTRPDRLAVELKYALNPPKEQGKSYDPDGCGLRFSTELKFNNKAFDVDRGNRWFIIDSIHRSYDDDCEIYNDFWTVTLRSVEKTDRYNKHINWCGVSFDDREEEYERIELDFKGKSCKGVGFDKKKINIIKKADA